MRSISWLGVVLGVLLIAGCQKKADENAATESAATGAPTLEELRNAEYTGFEEVSRPVTLKDGSWEGAPYDATSEVRPRASYLRDLRLEGDLDGDGSPEAVAFLAFASGGSGELLHLLVMDRHQGALRQRANAIVGDRVQIRDAHVRGRDIVVDVIQSGAGDPACCPGEMATRMWQLAGDSLTEHPSGVPPTRLMPMASGGHDWKLAEWSVGEPAPETPAVTLTYSAGRWSGTSGCNRYAASVSSGESAGDVIVGPAMGTRMACGAPADEVERRFLKQLGATRRIGFLAGRLALSYSIEDSVGTMLFVRAPAAADTGRTP
jgi:heat shock protein HslJ